jgi:hypothetical protein
MNSQPKHMSVEVIAAAQCKAQLQEELKELNKQKIQAMAEMDVPEELEDEQEECLRTSHVANATSMDGVDDIDIGPSNKEKKNPESDFIVNSEGSQEEVIQALKKGPTK